MVLELTKIETLLGLAIFAKSYMTVYTFSLRSRYDGSIVILGSSH